MTLPATPNLLPRTMIGVAVVEDHLEFQAAFVAAIEAAPDTHLDSVAGLLADGLQLLKGPAADVLLVDLGLPDGSGIDMIRATQKAWPECSIMVTTAFGDEAHVMQSIEAGASGYLLKDSSPEKIVEEIRNLHNGGSPISPLIARRVLQRLRAPTAISSPTFVSPATAIAADLKNALSARETQALELVAKGFSYEEIAGLMSVSRQTVLTFVRRIYVKLEVHSQMEAVDEARRQGLLAR
jgi:DNA-binding NarL/FixJ family response regulator